MSESIRPVVVAFPREEDARARLREMVGIPLPVIVPNSVDVPCIKCGVLLAVGPRSMGALVAGASGPYCPLCMRTLRGLDPSLTVNLGNPDSKPESS